MRVRATPYDYVMWDTKPFRPGKLFWHPPEQLAPIAPAHTKVVVRVPCRLDPVVLDYARLQPTSPDNDYKAGAVGFGASLFTRAEVCLTQTGRIQTEGDSQVVAKHIAIVMKRLTGYQGGLKISCRSHGIRHSGFSSTASICHAVANAINILLGYPVPPDLLVKIVAHNYAEESELKPSYLTAGISTGSSGHIAKSGGIVVVASDCDLILRCPIPEGTKVIGAIPPLESAGKGPETSAVDVHSLSWIRLIDRFNAAKVCYWILMDFMPAMIRGDLKTMGEVIYDIMFCGSKGAPLAPMHGGNLLGVIFEHRVAGVEMCFMSSAGPGLVTMTRDKEETAKAIFTRHGYEVIDMEPNNTGLETLDLS